MSQPTKAMVVLSGGQDSTTCLFWALQTFDEVHAVTVNYGQRHAREIEAAKRVWAIAEMTAKEEGKSIGEHHIVDVPQILRSTSPLTSSNALETYDSAEKMDEVIGNRVELTFVPMRNAFFLTLAANFALSYGIRDLVTGVCEEDNANYPDCRDIFIKSQQDTINKALGTDRGDMGAPLVIHTPLMKLSKAQSVEMALKVPRAYTALAYSHTAYSGEYPPVTQDHATVLRAHGFEKADVPDPLIVRAWSEGLMELPTTSNYSADKVDYAKGLLL